MRRCQHSPRITSAHFPDLHIHSARDEADVLAISGLSPEFLAALPGEARHEYVAAFRRARHLSVLPAARGWPREKSARN